MIKILVVDDSALIRKLLREIFGSQPGMEVRVARDGVEALQQLHDYVPDVVTLDIHMPRMDGLACLDRIMVERPCPVVMLSSLTAVGADATLEAFSLGAVDFVAKPEGAISLGIRDIADQLVAKVRAAASAKLRISRRLRERVRHRLSASTPRGAAARHGAPVNDPASLLALPADGLVLIGTSTGGPPALETVLTALPASFPWPIVVAQHMPRTFTNALARRLDGVCALSVVEVQRPTELKPGIVCFGRGDADVIVSRRAVGLVAAAAPPSASYPWHPSADRLVRSAMEHVAARQLIGVLMTGMGSDGAEAMARLHAAGGKTIAEAEETAIVWGMPGELVKAGGADWVLPLPEIADFLRRLLC